MTPLITKNERDYFRESIDLFLKYGGGINFGGFTYSSRRFYYEYWKYCIDEEDNSWCENEQSCSVIFCHTSWMRMNNESIYT